MDKKEKNQKKFNSHLRALFNRKTAGMFLLGVLLVLILIALNYYYIVSRTKGQIFSQSGDIPKQKVAIVFGAMIYRDGSPSPFLRDRVAGAVELYKQGKVEKILMTGDNGSVNYDEVTNMKKYAIKLGVPEKSIALDYAGFSTYDSCYRARAIFGLNKAILISQNYHLPRAVYTCHKLGVEATGFGQPDWSHYSDVMPRTEVRELLAQVKMMIELYVTHPLPKFLGHKESV